MLSAKQFNGGKNRKRKALKQEENKTEGVRTQGKKERQNKLRKKERNYYQIFSSFYGANGRPTYLALMSPSGGIFSMPRDT